LHVLFSLSLNFCYSCKFSPYLPSPFFSSTNVPPLSYFFPPTWCPFVFFSSSGAFPWTPCVCFLFSAPCLLVPQTCYSFSLFLCPLFIVSCKPGMDVVVPIPKVCAKPPRAYCFCFPNPPASLVIFSLYFPSLFLVPDVSSPPPSFLIAATVVSDGFYWFLRKTAILPALCLFFLNPSLPLLPSSLLVPVFQSSDPLSPPSG